MAAVRSLVPRRNRWDRRAVRRQDAQSPRGLPSVPYLRTFWTIWPDIRRSAIPRIGAEHCLRNGTSSKWRFLLFERIVVASRSVHVSGVRSCVTTQYQAPLQLSLTCSKTYEGTARHPCPASSSARTLRWTRSRASWRGGDHRADAWFCRELLSQAPRSNR
jgi:hypothetical protein